MIEYDTDSAKPNTMVILSRFDGLVTAFPDMYFGLVLDSVLTDNNKKYCFKIDHNDNFLYKITSSLIGQPCFCICDQKMKNKSLFLNGLAADGLIFTSCSI